LSATEQLPADRTLRNSAWAIAATAVIIAVAGALTIGARFGTGVLVGGAVSALNFVALARIGRGIGSERSALWGLLYVAKVLGLFVVVFVVLRAGIASGVGIVAGLCSVAPGIVIGALTAR
jgi:hypothetical protein